MSRLPSLVLVVYAVVTLVVAVWIAVGGQGVITSLSILRAAVGLGAAWGLLSGRRWAHWFVLALAASELWTVVSVSRHAALIRDVIPHFAVWRASHWLGLGLVVVAALLASGARLKPGTA